MKSDHESSNHNQNSAISIRTKVIVDYLENKLQNPASDQTTHHWLTMIEADHEIYDQNQSS